MIWGEEQAAPDYNGPSTDEAKRKRAIAEYAQLQQMQLGSGLRSVLEQQIIHGNNHAATQAGSAIANLDQGHPGLTNSPNRDALIAQMVSQGQAMDAQQQAQQAAQQQAGHQRFLEQSARTPVVVGGTVNGQNVVAPGAGHGAAFDGAMAGMGLNPNANISPTDMLAAQVEAAKRSPAYIGQQAELQSKERMQQGINNSHLGVAAIQGKAHVQAADITAGGRVDAAGMRGAGLGDGPKETSRGLKAVTKTIDEGYRENVTAFRKRLASLEKVKLGAPLTDKEKEDFKDQLNTAGVAYAVDHNGMPVELSDKNKYAASPQARALLEAARYGLESPAAIKAFDSSAATFNHRLDEGTQASVWAGSKTWDAPSVREEAARLIPAAQQGDRLALAKLDALRRIDTLNRVGQGDPNSIGAPPFVAPPEPALSLTPSGSSRPAASYPKANPRALLSARQRIAADNAPRKVR